MSNRTPESSLLAPLSPLAPELAATVARVGSDIALVIDEHGVISSAAFADETLAPPANSWVGRKLADIVTAETRGKIDQLLSEAAAGGSVRRRQVNHPMPGGIDLPVAYSAVRLGAAGPLLVAGRDLRAVAAIQQRFVESQQEMERDYWRRRQDEARYRLLFQVATDAVLVADARTRHVIEANQAAAEMFGLAAADMVGCDVADWVVPVARAGVEELLSAVAATGRPAEIRVRLRRGNAGVSLAASTFAHDATPLLLLRARHPAGGVAADADTAALVDLVERTPDAIVIADMRGVVRTANAAFMALCGLGGADVVAGRPLGTWIGMSANETMQLIDLTRRQGIVARAGTEVRNAQGELSRVELSAVLLPEGEEATVGITLRRLTKGVPAPSPVTDELALAVEQLVRRLGDSDLPTMLREANELIERELLRAALARAGGERDRAAELLGISRASLDLRLLRQRLDGAVLRAAGDPTPGAC